MLSVWEERKVRLYGEHANVGKEYMVLSVWEERKVRLYGKHANVGKEYMVLSVWEERKVRLYGEHANVGKWVYNTMYIGVCVCVVCLTKSTASSSPGNCEWR